MRSPSGSSRSKSNRQPLARYRRAFLEQLEERSLLAAIISVNSTLDTNARDSVLTLREAILISNRSLAVANLTAAEKAQVVGSPSSSDTDTIAFNIVGGGVKTIAISTQLPNVDEPAIIDGYTQPGAIVNTNAIDDPNPAKRGFNGTLLIELKNASQVSNGLVLSSGSTVRGLVINNFKQKGVSVDSNCVVEGNFIGTDATGLLDRGNGDGIIIYSSNNRIGGTSPSSRNIISNNDWGIAIEGSGSAKTSDNVIQGNLIGTDASGTKSLGNKEIGIFSYQTLGDSIGGTQAGARNIVSGNLGPGIYVESSESVAIQGNYIGIDVSGSKPLGNEGAGVFLAGFSHNLVGGLTAEARNVISGNFGGVYISSHFNTVQGNFIGTDATGLLPLGNSFDGIFISTGIGVNNQIGGSVSAAGNRIAFNGHNGVTIDSFSNDNSILLNTIFSNGALGLVLSPDAIGNSLQNFPSFKGGNQTANFHVPENSTVVADVDATDPDPRSTLTYNISGGADAAKFAIDAVSGVLTFATAPDFEYPKDAGGNNVYEVVVRVSDGGLTNTQAIAVTVTNVAEVCSTVVINTNDTGPGSLREAINCTNATTNVDRDGDGASEPDVITFNIPGAGVKTIRPATALPVISDSVIIDGYTQPGATPNTNAIDDPDPTKRGFNGVLQIELSGAGLSNASGLTIAANGCTVRGLVINRFVATPRKRSWGYLTSV